MKKLILSLLIATAAYVPSHAITYVTVSENDNCGCGGPSGGCSMYAYEVNADGDVIILGQWCVDPSLCFPQAHGKVTAGPMPTLPLDATALSFSAVPVLQGGWVVDMTFTIKVDRTENHSGMAFLNARKAQIIQAANQCKLAEGK